VLSDVEVDLDTTEHAAERKKFSNISNSRRHADSRVLVGEMIMAAVHVRTETRLGSCGLGVAPCSIAVDDLQVHIQDGASGVRGS